MTQDYRHLRSDKLIETAEKVAGRIALRFPDAGLSDVARVLVDVCRAAAEKAEKIQQPIWWLRITLIAIAAVTVAFGAGVAFTLTGDATKMFLDFARQAAPALGFLAAGVWFLVTLETRWKRDRAIAALHELRAIAHIIDMHQLAKTPDPDVMVGYTPLNEEAMRHYLQFCTELLAILSKIGQLYVQDFPDDPTLAAVERFESLTTGLSAKIWQKIMILEQPEGPATA